MPAGRATTPRWRGRPLTPEQVVAYNEWNTARLAASWDCPHGVQAGSLARPAPYYGPRCPMCRASGYASWRHVHQLGRIPESYL